MTRSNNKTPSFIKKFCSEAGILAFGSVIFVGIIFLYILSTPVFLFRLVIKKAAMFLRPDFATIVSSQANFFAAELFSSKSPRCSIVVPIVLQGNFTESYFRIAVTKMVNRKDKETGKDMYPEYKQCIEIWFGFAFWKKDSQFDIRNHVKLHNTNDRFATRQKLSDVVEELLNKKFHPKRSPWELIIMNNYDDPELPAGEKTVMIMRVHHSLADGFSLLFSLIEGLTNNAASSIQLPTPNHVKRDKWSKLKFELTFPLRLVHDLGDYLIKGIRKHPFNIPDDKKSWRQIYKRIKPIAMQKIKEIKNELGVSFTSVLLAAVAAATSAITKAKMLKEDDLGDRAAFFIPLPLPGGHLNAMINHMTGAQIDLPMDTFADPTMRVRDCDLQLRKQKSSTIPWMLHFFGRTLGLYFSSIAGEISANRVNVSGLTSFPAGENEIYFDDDGKVLSMELAVGALIGISGVGFMAISYGRNMYFSLTAESSCLSKREADTLLTMIYEEIDVLHKIVVSELESK